MRASVLYTRVYSSQMSRCYKSLKTFAVHSACVRPFDYCFGSKQEREREKGRGRDKDGAANSFPTVYRDNFFGNFFDKYTLVCKKGSCSQLSNGKNSIPLHGNRWSNPFPRQCAIRIFNKYLDFNIYQRIRRENLIEWRHRFSKFSSHAQNEENEKKCFPWKTVPPSRPVPGLNALEGSRNASINGINLINASRSCRVLADEIGRAQLSRFLPAW